MDLDKRVTDACHRIEELYYETGGKCYVSFSGGKDSTVLLALIKLCEDIYTIPVGGIPAVFSNTGIELGVTVNFVQWVKNSGWYSNVQIIRPEHSFDWCIKTYGKPLKSKVRSEYIAMWQKGKRSENVFRAMVTGIANNGSAAKKTKIADKDLHMLSDSFGILASPMCCNVLKKKPMKKYAKENGIIGTVYGVRMDEGGARELAIHKKQLQGGKICTFVDSKGMIKKAPIVDWSTEDIEAFIESYNVPLSDAYTKYGFKRTGCMACPFNSRVNNDLEYLYNHEPNRYKAAMHWLKDVYIAQNVVLPFDEAYERERESMARPVRTNAARNVAEIPA